MPTEAEELSASQASATAAGALRGTAASQPEREALTDWLLDTLYGIAGEASGQHADPLRTLKVIEAYARAAIAKAAEGR